MDSGHRELSQDADGPDSSPGERASCPLLIQQPALDTVQTHPGGILTCPRERRQNHLAGPDGAVQTLFGPEDSGVVQTDADRSVVAHVPDVLTCIRFTQLVPTFLSMFKLLMFSVCVCAAFSLLISDRSSGFWAAADWTACSPRKQKVSLQGGLD